MSLKVCIYEDRKYKQFFPISLMRPVYLMRAGIEPQYMRIERRFKPQSTVLCSRNSLSSVLTEKIRNYPVNIIKQESKHNILFINGRIREMGNLPELVEDAEHSTIFVNNRETIAILFKKDTQGYVPKVTTPSEYVKVFKDNHSDFFDFETTATLYNYTWEFVADIPMAIFTDFNLLKPDLPMPDQLKVHQGFQMINPDHIFLGSGVEAMPGAFIDASLGPVYIDSLTRIEAQAAIYGPCYIGPNSIITAGKVSHSSVGHTCRIGGEVEESIFQSYVNKYHDGFIGHSYVGSWVNFGAMTTNSDLKNNYSNIRVSIDGETIDTGSIKVGSIIGDHTKFGIGTLLNTGINIGVGCNIFGGGLLVDKEVSSFQWGGVGGWQKYEIDKAIDTAKATSERRNCKLSDSEEALLREISGGVISEEGVLEFPAYGD